jgi:hypothetical protein
MAIVRFEVLILEEAKTFLKTIDQKAMKKLMRQLHLATTHIDPKVFKKLDDVLWEFRVESNRLQYRMLAFWDRHEGQFSACCNDAWIYKENR